MAVASISVFTSTLVTVGACFARAPIALLAFASGLRLFRGGDSLFLAHALCFAGTAVMIVFAQTSRCVAVVVAVRVARVIFLNFATAIGLVPLFDHAIFARSFRTVCRCVLQRQT
jgi:hypothetical protein